MRGSEAGRAADGSTTWRVPGRIEVLGKHTDYAGGRVLVCAIDRAVAATVTPGARPGVVARTDAYPDAVALADGDVLPPGHWGRYLASVVERLELNFGPLPDCALALTSDLPPASGMSSSSAMLCASTLALADHAGFTSSAAWREHCPDRFALAQYLARVENGGTWGRLAGHAGVGTKGGSEDHTAMLCGRAGHLLQADFTRDAEVGHVALPGDLALVVAVSGVLAEKTGAALGLYNRTAAAAQEVLQTWRTRTGREDRTLAGAVHALVGEEPDEATLAGPALTPLRACAAPGYATDRLQQFLTESFLLVPAAARALAAGDVAGFADVVALSQQLAETHLGNQVPETVALVRLARELGAVAASAFGAGFGGSVWALVARADAEAVAAAWEDRYRRAFPHRTPTMIITAPAAAGGRID